MVVCPIILFELFPSEKLNIHGLEPVNVIVTLTLFPAHAVPPPETVAVGNALSVTLKEAEVAGQEPEAGIVFVTVYVPAELEDKFITPVVGDIDNPDGVALKVPILAPGPKIGVGFAASKQ